VGAFRLLRSAAVVCGFGCPGSPLSLPFPPGKGERSSAARARRAHRDSGQGLNLQERSVGVQPPSALDGFRGRRRGALKQQHLEAAAALRQQLRDVRCCCLGGGSGAFQDHREEASAICAAAGPAHRGHAPSPSDSRLARAASAPLSPGGKEGIGANPGTQRTRRPLPIAGDANLPSK